MSRLPRQRQFGFSAARRLRSPVEFVAVTSDPRAWRAARTYLAAVGRITSAGPSARVPVRFGFTVGKRQARRAVDRNRVRRVLREAARRAIPALDAAVGARALDVVLRLKVPVVPGSSSRTFKRLLREEADSLLAQLTQRVSGVVEARA